MAVREIVTYPDPVLTTPTKEVTDFGADLHTLLDDMAETMYCGDGIGLAAPQVGVSLRVAVMDVASSEDQGPGLMELINPKIVEREGTTVYEEGCLSFPYLLAEVQRADRVKVAAQDRNGEAFEVEADGLKAICLQHELDHLDGVVFIDRLSALKRKFALREYRKLVAEQQAD